MDTGGKIRTGNILEQLSKMHEITLISNVESPGDDAHVTDMNRFCTRFIPVPWKEVKRTSPLFFIKLFFQMFSLYPVNVLNDYSTRLRKAVEKELAREPYDLAVCDFVQSALLFKNVRHLPTLLFQHNVESVISHRHIGQNTNPVIKLFWWLQWRKMYHFEKKACRQFETVIAVSENDRDLFRKLYAADNVSTIPTGVNIEYYKPGSPEEITPDTLVFCGSMDWLPNEDAVLFFIHDILPVIRRKIKDVHLTVVGRNPSAALKKQIEKIPQVTLTGWVDDTRPYIAASAAFIVPIRIGGGTRMKIYEAMAMGKAVVSTTIGAEGLPVKDKEHLMIADAPGEFGNAVIELLSDPEKRAHLGTNARNYVKHNFAWQSVARVFSNICTKTKKRA
jgi:glycosyltransferase involved in cell wall biosynthesis